MHDSPRWLAAELGVSVQLLEHVAERASAYYRHSTIPKPNGKSRPIDKTVGDLRFLQDRIKDKLLAPFVFPESMHGCVKRRSPLTNAQRHTNKPLVLTMDLVDFYPSVTCDHVYAIWRTTFKLGPPIASILTRLTTHLGHLPQGVPTSGYLANIHIISAARRIAASEAGWTSTFFVDDIAASGENARAAIEVIVDAIAAADLSIGHRKTRLMPRGGRQHVTGYNVDRDRPSVPLEKRDRIRSAINELRQQLEAGGDGGLLHRSILGRINHVRMTNAGSASRLETYLALVIQRGTLHA